MRWYIFQFLKLLYIRILRKFQFQCFEEESDSGDWMVESDPQLLSISLNNLYENAIKYASHSPILIVLRELSTSYTLEVINTTITSFENINLNDLKDKFVRGVSPESGQGLGLYISYKIALALDIKFDLELKDNQFIVRLLFNKTTALI